MPRAASFPPASWSGRALKYATGVTKGQIVAGSYLKLAAARFIADLKRASSPRGAFTFSPAHVDDACEFISALQHVDGTWPRVWAFKGDTWHRTNEDTAKPQKLTVHRPEALPPAVQGWWQQEHDGWAPSHKGQPGAAYIRAGARCLVADDPYLTLEDCQVFWLANIFGFRRRADGLRRFTLFYIELARKNAKSTLLAGICLYCFTCEGEKGPQIWSGATTYKQARIVFDIARRMVKKDADLQEAFQLEVLANSIVCHANGGFWQAIHSKAETQDGLNPHVASLDEVHAHKTPALFNVLNSAMGARKAPLMALITTAGYVLDGIGFSMRSMLIKILKGVEPLDHIWGVIYTVDEKDDPFNPAVWAKANPLLGVSVSEAYLANKAGEAQANAQQAGEFKTKHLNLWLNAANALINMKAWSACADPSLSSFRVKSDLIDAAALGHSVGQALAAHPSLAGATVRLGCDLSGYDDLSSVVLEFEVGELITWVDFHFLPRELVKARAHDTTSHFNAWADEGAIILTDGDYIDHAYIKRFIVAVSEHLPLHELGFDQYNGGHQIVVDLAAEGLNAKIYPKKPTTFTDPTNDLLARIKSGRFRHTGSGPLTWMASNVVGELRTDGSILPKKESKHSKNKIDGIDAGLEAAGLRLTAREAELGAVFAGGMP